jgi:ribonuclease T1
MRRALIICWALVLACAVACQTGTASPVPPALCCASPSAPASALDIGSGLPFIALADLPAEAAATVALIENGGPYPYSQDGAVFQNREGILPDQPQGYYHEYTVETPGSADRGARRIVAGGFGAGELYWSDDHYASFARISR